MNRIKRGWALTKKSWSILRENPKLMQFPLYGGVLATLLTVLTLGPGLFFIEDDLAGVGIPLAILGLYIATFTGFYFSVGLAASADQLFRGEQTSLGQGLGVARGRVGAIAGWALVSVVIATLLDLLREKAGFLGAILGSVLSLGWALISFLAVPVIALEGTGPWGTLKRSAGIFRERWGQQVTGNIAIGGITFLIGFLPAVGLIVGGIALWATSGFFGAVLVICGVILLIAAMLFQRAMSVIFGVALYRYATEGAVVGGFTAEEMESAVRIKGAGRTPGVATPGTI